MIVCHYIVIILSLYFYQYYHHYSCCCGCPQNNGDLCHWTADQLSKMPWANQLFFCDLPSTPKRFKVKTAAILFSGHGSSLGWLVVWNMAFIFPYIGNNHPNWLSYFSEGLNPPTSRILVRCTVHWLLLLRVFLTLWQSQPFIWILV